MVILLSIAAAAPVVCDASIAEALVVDAKLDRARIPITEPNLLPGLMRSSSDPALIQALDTLCVDPESASLSPLASWTSARFSAFSYVLTSSRTEGCALIQESAVLTVGLEPGEELAVGLQGLRPTTITPLEPCDVEPQYHSERVLQGSGTPVRLILTTDHHGAQAHHQIVARRATPQGWIEQVLFDPAPARVLDPHGSGPLISLHGTDDPWIVVHSDREVSGDRCTPLGGQVVWRWHEDSWIADRGRDALARLADRGAWRLAGDDGWFLILAQDNDLDREVLQSRKSRIERRTQTHLNLWESASFPKMNAGFLIVAPDPWPTRAEAVAARRQWTRRNGVYVRQGWSALDPCEDAPR